MSGEMVGRDLYYRVTTRAGSHVEHARVWDAERFLAAQREAGMKPKEENDRFTVSPATEQEYRDAKKARA